MSGMDVDGTPLNADTMKELSDCNGWWLVGATVVGAGVWALLILALVRI